MIELTSQNFQSAVLDNPGKVLVDFWATWCGPCKMLAPIIEQIAEENPDITVCKADVDQDMALAAQFGIASIPTVIAFENGKPVGKQIGYCPKDVLLKLFD